MMLSAAYRNIRMFFVLGCLLCGIAGGQAEPAVPAQTPAQASAQTQPPAAGAAGTARETKISPEPKLPTVTRGQTVMVMGDNFPKSVTVLLRTGKETGGDKGKPVDAVVAGDGKNLSFKVPTDPFKTGRYLVYISYDTPAVPATSKDSAVPAGTKELAVPGDLTVGPDDGPKVRVDSISPTTDYRDNDNVFKFDISGDNLAPVATDNVIEVVGRGPLAVSGAADCKPHDRIVCVSYAPGVEGHKLTVTGYEPDQYEGPVQFRVHTGNSVSDSKRVVFSSISETRLRAAAIGVFLLIAVIVLWMVWRGIGIYKIAGESYTPLSSFFLDKETNSYSLSKFQLVAWTTVAVFGYIYLLCCQSLIQWSFKFPDIPSGWPTLLGVSAATTVTAVGITSARGSKGAGPVLPSLADFITSGGMVLSSRFQFFVWTLVGCAGFLFLTLKNDPSSFTALPDVPSGFLYLMGISAAGYLSGKLVNLPGPVVQQLLVSSVFRTVPGAPPAQLVINLRGQNLSTNASVKVDDKDLRMTDEFVIECVTPQSQPPDPSFCTEIKVTLKAADNYLDGEHTLVITNKDGQMVASKFPLDALTITPVGDLTAGATPVDVVANGTNFVVGMTAVWKNAALVETTIQAGQVQKKSDTQLVVTLVPGVAGKGTLTLVSPIGLRSHADVTVKDPNVKP
jgi:hypothetical protein